MTRLKEKEKVALWLARAALMLVFIINLQCALAFLIFPERYIAAYGLSGGEGIAALQGLAVAFLMWNATYPFAIAQPEKYRIVFVIVLIQQLIGLLGESFIYFNLESTQSILASSILRFIAFDAAGLVLMSSAFIFLSHRTKRSKQK